MLYYINNLRALRQALAEKSRRLAQDAVDTAAANDASLPSVAWCADIKVIQEELKALDEAIAEEKRFADSVAAAADQIVSVMHAPAHPDS
ncbi:hypothetical protein NLM33_38550 [Bradyrhizobium sp. CCGUVB1N3]|uniref:hypothetical protein n=1 Tax=Bradyrhizobium sp. CCGUVB1N3 TaxID=2949629 RepID=UPI0020B26184|nr:hypothetical protein [Bradyrhizobium sp. CCGUVB1N3]MCP3476130.1 hypothetical protein [Bradyrhizobium sp. CCGUVB1N3]